jgi:serine/threonine-protein kinase
VTSPSDRDDPGVCEGDVLAGKYRVDEVLGIGGMGVVVAAHHLQLDEKVAIKFLLPHALRNEEAVARFEREARAAVKIKSEHVARVIDVGALDNGAPYMVMEHLDGHDLNTWLHERGPLDVEQAVEFVLQACEALAEAHALGIIHRDLKPANLVCIRRRDGLLSVKVLDFGISKVTGVGASESDMGMTNTQAMMGSPMYMSPEQMRSAKDVDPRADLWSLGIILFELLSGSPPFTADSMPQLVLKVMTGSPPELREARPEVPPGLDKVILRCLEKDRDDRYANVAELASALAEFGPDRSIASAERASRVIQTAGMSVTALATPSPAPLCSEPAPGAGTLAPWWRAKPNSSGRRTALVAVLAVAAASLGAGAFALLTNGTRSDPPPRERTLPAAVAPPRSAPSSRPALPPPPASASAAAASSASASAIVSAPPRIPKKRPPPRAAPTPSAVPPSYDPLDHL